MKRLNNRNTIRKTANNFDAYDYFMEQDDNEKAQAADIYNYYRQAIDSVDKIPEFIINGDFKLYERGEVDDLYKSKLNQKTAKQLLEAIYKSDKAVYDAICNYFFAFDDSIIYGDDTILEIIY